MKKLLLLLCLLLLPLTYTLGEENHLYTAVTKSEFHLRPAKEAPDFLSYVPVGTRVRIYEVSGDWCRAVILGEEGWCKLRWLDHFSAAHIQMEAQYEAITHKELKLRLQPDSSIVVGTAPYDRFVDVYEYGEEWCRIGYEDVVGWCKTSQLWAFRSLNVAKYPALHVTPNLGMVTLSQEAWIASDDFVGMMARSGAIICVRAADDHAYSLPVWRTEGTISREAGELIPFIPWEEAQPGDVIGGFTTFYDENYGKDLAANRAYNIDLACRRIHNTVMQPGDHFSYNALCAPYKVSNGYLIAPNISKSGKGYGGGVCQLTTTLYNAILPLPLQIDEWRVHQKIGVVYIPQYYDAAVGSFYDLEFNNTLPYPIRIFAQPQEGAVTVLIYRAE